jgi:hypothetical protein
MLRNGPAQSGDERQQTAAQKAARTRAANRAAQDRAALEALMVAESSQFSSLHVVPSNQLIIVHLDRPRGSSTC